MGEPITLTPEERAVARAYAVEVIEAVRDDVELPSLRAGSTRETDLVHLAVELHDLAVERFDQDAQLVAQRDQIQQLERDLAAAKTALIAAAPTEDERHILRWLREELQGNDRLQRDIRYDAALELFQRYLTMRAGLR